MRILLDTNILILRENSHIVPENLAKLMRFLNILNYSVRIHPLSIEEIKKDGDEQRRNINISKLNAYPVLEKYPDYLTDTDFKSQIGATKELNDVIDNQLIYCIVKNRSDCLITEDKGILSKAKNLHIDNIVNVAEAVKRFEKLIPSSDINLIPSCEIDKGGNFNLKDPIFDTLKSEYTQEQDFEHWWNTKVVDRDVYYSKNHEGNLNAVLVPKIEKQDEIDKKINPPLLRERILKLCLFKVADHMRGFKLGERLLRMGIDYAIKNNLDEMYLTHFRQENDTLIYLIEKFGFEKHGTNAKGEEVYLKRLNADKDFIISNKDNCIDFNRIYYPSFYGGSLVKKHIIPIIPEFHKKLFPDYKNDNLQLPLFTTQPQDNSEGNSIKKAYLCNSKNKRVSSCDIILFYQSQKNQSVTSLGTVEQVFYDQTDPNEIKKLITNRTVFSDSDIEQLCQKPVLVILFNHNFHLINDLTSQNLIDNGIIKRAPQSIMEISHENYMKVVEGNIDECFIIN